MQNMDFYNGQSFHETEQSYGRQDPEYFARMSKFQAKEDTRIRRKASRIIFIIAALCIISFTTGLAIGIKFAGGSERQIVDEKTFNAVKDLGTKVSGMFNRKNSEKFTTEQFPRDKYPYVIKVGDSFDYSKSQKIANFLSVNGHTVIISKNNNRYTLFTGPYPDRDQAKRVLKKITTYKQFSLASVVKILKRK